MLIEIDGLNVQSERKQIIRDFNLEVASGERIVLAGPSGSGKSTILKYLAQLHDPALNVSGQYHFKGQDIHTYDPIQVRQTISYCYQTPTLFGETVRDNLIFPYDIRQLAFDENHAIELLQRVNLSEAYLNNEINTLSGGERQRVALVRNLLFKPEVLLLDEITSALDPVTKEIIWTGLQEYHQDFGITFIMISHSQDEHQYADRLIELRPLAETAEVPDGE